MNTIILNGSPKGNAKNSSSYLLAKAFVSNMDKPYKIYSIYKDAWEDLMAAVQQADCIIIITPNYIHSVPAKTLDFIYSLPKGDGKKHIGYIIQSGYPESSESDIICRYLERLTNCLGYTFLGTVVKAGCAGLGICADLNIMQNKFEPLKNDFSAFGALFEKTKAFDPSLSAKFASPIYLSKFQTCMLNLMSPLENFIGWNRVLKSNNCYKTRYDTPFLK